MHEAEYMKQRVDDQIGWYSNASAKAKTDPYVGEQNFKLLVQRVESLISKENTGWIQSTRVGKKASEEPNGVKT